MKITKTLLTAAVLTAISGSVFAAETALPENASDQYARTTYFGKGNTTEGTTLTERSTVIGSLNTIKRATDMTTIIGDSNSVDGKNNTVIGSTNIVQGHDSVVIGVGAQAGASVVPDGDDAPLLTLGSAEGHGVTVIGTNAWATTEYASAIGYAAQSLGKNSIALGSYSAAGEMHAADSKYAGVSNNKGVLSIGAKDPGSSINYSNPTVSEPWASDFTRQIQHVSAGEVSATSTDAINGSQLQDAFDRSATNATNIATNAANIIKAKTTVTAGDNVTVTSSTNTDGSTNYEVAVASTVTDKLDTLANTAVVDAGKNLVASNVNGKRTVALADDINNVHTANFTTGGNLHTHVSESGVAVHNGSARTITSATGVLIENGDTLTQAQFDTSGMTASDDNGSVAFTTHHIFANDQIIHGVKAGVADTDAVNVKQLKDSVSKAVADASPTVSGSGAVEVTTSTNSNGSTNYNVSLNTDGIREIAKTSNRYAGDKVVKVERWNNPTGSADLTTFKFDENEAAKVLPITYKANGEDAKTTTAANGFNFVDTDTVKASVEADGVVKFNVAKSVTDAIADNAKGVKDNAKAIDDLAKNTNDRLNDVVNGIDGLNGKVGENAKAIDGLKSDVVKAKTTVTAGNSVTVKETTNTNGSVNYEVAVDPKVTDQVKANTDAIGENTKGIQANADAIKELAKANNALAKEATDGLNGLNGRVDSLASKVDANQKEARRGIASASALAALHPLDYNPEHKVDVMAGVGHYRGNTAVALGAAYRPNENVMFTVGASINGKDSAINAGISYKVGTKDGVDYKYSKVAMQRHIDELNTTVAAQNEKIEQLNNLVEKLLEEVHQSK